MARPIQLCAPSTLWPAQFTTEQRRIEQALLAQLPAPVAATYQLWHIGSTAVPGLWAKPIIDMLLCVPDQASLDACVALLQGLGYQHKGANGIVGRQYFVLPAGVAPPWLASPTDGQDRTHHLHAFVQGHPASDSHLALRDFFACSPTSRHGLQPSQTTGFCAKPRPIRSLRQRQRRLCQRTGAAGAAVATRNPLTTAGTSSTKTNAAMCWPNMCGQSLCSAPPIALELMFHGILAVFVRFDRCFVVRGGRHHCGLDLSRLQCECAAELCF